VRDRVVVGREATCDIVLDDKSVSRRHAYLERRGTAWFVADQGSANGTFINGQQVVEAQLQQGQELRLGTLSLWVELEEEAPQTILMGGQGAAPAAPAAAAWSGQADAYGAGGGYAAQPGYAAAPAYGAPAYDPGYGAAAPAYAPPAADPQAEAAALLGVYPGAPAQQVAERYREVVSDLEMKIQHAPNAHLRSTYQRNVEEARRAYETLVGSPPPSASAALGQASPAALAHAGSGPAGHGMDHGHMADLPAAQPSLVEEALESAIEEVSRPAPPPREAVASRAGGPSSLTTALGATIVLLFGFSTYFCMGAGKKRKELTTLERAGDTVAARTAWALYQPVNELEKAGALKNAKFSICNKSSQAVQIGWLGALFTEMPTNPALIAQGPQVKVYNSMFCAGEFSLTIPPGAEQAVSFKSDKATCNWAGEGLYYALWLKRTVPPPPPPPGKRVTTPPAPTEQMVYYSGLLNGRKDCVTIGEGW
jgi:hypothetical protein